MSMSYFFRKAFMSSGSEETADHKKGSYQWKQDHLTPDQLKRTKDNSARFSGIPAIPTDIGYNAGKEVSGKKKTGTASNAVSNPVVIIGMGLTTMALLGMFRKSIKGDRLGAQKYMQYRIIAQFFTVTALVAGVTIFAGSDEEPQPKKAVLPVAAVAPAAAL